MMAKIANVVNGANVIGKFARNITVSIRNKKGKGFPYTMQLAKSAGLEIVETLAVPLVAVGKPL